MSLFCKKQEELVECEKCGCLIKKETAQEITIWMQFIPIDSDRYEYYCKFHEKQYDIMDNRTNYPILIKYYKRRMEVDRDGIPVGYKKVVNQKQTKK